MGGAGEKKTDNPLIARRNIQYVGDLSEVPPAEKRDYTMEEIAKFDGSDKSKPLIFAINGEVYDITRWVSRHPGGKIVAQYAGEDATDVYTAMHPDKEVSNKYMKTYKIGNVVSQKIPQHLVEFRELRKQAESEGLFKPNYFFYLFHLGHILLAEFVAWWLMTTYSSSWLVWIFGCAILGGAQAQAGWLQHDFGHLSVFKKSSTNHWAHRFFFVPSPFFLSFLSLSISGSSSASSKLPLGVGGIIATTGITRSRTSPSRFVAFVFVNQITFPLKRTPMSLCRMCLFLGKILPKSGPPRKR